METDYLKRILDYLGKGSASPSKICQDLKMSPKTLSFYLKQLEGSVVLREKTGRRNTVLYSKIRTEDIQNPKEHQDALRQIEAIAFEKKTHKIREDEFKQLEKESRNADYSLLTRYNFETRLTAIIVYCKFELGLTFTLFLDRKQDFPLMKSSWREYKLEKEKFIEKLNGLIDSLDEDMRKSVLDSEWTFLENWSLRVALSEYRRAFMTN